ncbi:hypothetical protein LK994_00925 [Ferruginibacter lapsinanis]|uniref:hypothetical protein n=1 Tax=Ferruginibacter lapsinanis TaxID=563172 RepID=UPI001E2941BD|nr:hypothetical protein [Ferruginibacter lapsinanis]UEG50036.1 hypothetical protein LK994_00925 [Ferruginibacter lapsinanis]
MIHVKNHFIYNPWGENESSNKSSGVKDEIKDKTEQNPPNKKEEHKSIFKKIKEALQEWSNGDQRDLDFDDTRV